MAILAKPSRGLLFYIRYSGVPNFANWHPSQDVNQHLISKGIDSHRHKYV